MIKALDNAKVFKNYYFNYHTDKMTPSYSDQQKDMQTKLMKGLLDLIVLNYLGGRPMHGYQVIDKIRKTFGVYFGPSTVYPLLNCLEKQGYTESEWNIVSGKPRKIYRLTQEGQNLLSITEDSLNIICKKMGLKGTKDENEKTDIRMLPEERKLKH